MSKLIKTREDGDVKVRVKLRYDDSCGNGHKTFSMTGSMSHKDKRVTEGCMHEEICEMFPEYRRYVKWHLCSEHEPLHYIANTIYLAGDRDHWGLREGEIKFGDKEIHVLGVETQYDWQEKYRRPDGFLPINMVKAIGKIPSETLVLPQVRLVGEGKQRQLDAARNCAIWPDATDEELMADNLKERLMARLPALMKEFHADMKELFDETKTKGDE